MNVILNCCFAEDILNECDIEYLKSYFEKIAKNNSSLNYLIVSTKTNLLGINEIENVSYRLVNKMFGAFFYNKFLIPKIVLKHKGNILLHALPNSCAVKIPQITFLFNGIFLKKIIL